jgi:hypothetical protein
MILDAEFHATDGVVAERAGQARECDFDAEPRRRGGRGGEAAKSKRGRARRQRRMVAFGSERTGFRRGRRGKVKIGGSADWGWIARKRLAIGDGWWMWAIRGIFKHKS